MMLRKALYIPVLLLLFCCNDRTPLKIDYKQAVGVVIAKEMCDEAGRNAWLIAFDDKLSQNLYGLPVIHHGDTIRYAVKTYNIDLSQQYSDSTSQYLFEYYDKNIPEPLCTEDTLNSYAIPTIEIRNVFKLSR